MQKDRPPLPRILKRPAQFLLVGHAAEAALRIGMGKRISDRGSTYRPLRRAPGSQFQQRLGRLGGKMIRQGQESVLVSYLLDVIKPRSGYAVVQQLAVRYTGEHGALSGDVARDLDFAHHLADLDELRRTGVRMLFKPPALRPPIRVVVHADIAEQEIGRCLVRNHAHALTDPHRPEVLVPGPVHPMKL